MSFVQVDSSIRTHRKFLQAGPAAAWLWLCSTAYSQEALTDGFISFEVVRYLGVQSPKPLIPKLVKAGLWDVVEGGWQIHDYLHYNKSASEVHELKRLRSDGGKLGGRPRKEPPRETLKVRVEETSKANLPRNPYPYTSPDPYPSTPTSPSTDTAAKVRPQPIFQRRRLDAAWEGARVYVPQRTHTDFLGFRGGNEPELLTWYEAIDNSYVGEIDPDMFVFWKARYREKWPPTAETKQDARVPQWAR